MKRYYFWIPFVSVFEFRNKERLMFNELKTVVFKTLGLKEYPATDEPEYKILRERFARAIFNNAPWFKVRELSFEEISRVIQSLNTIEPILLDQELYDYHHSELESHGIEIHEVPEFEPWNAFVNRLREEAIQHFKATYPHDISKVSREEESEHTTQGETANGTTSQSPNLQESRSNFGRSDRSRSS